MTRVYIHVKRIWDELGAKEICARVFSVEAPLKVGTKSFLTSAAGRREKKRRTPLHPTAYRSSRTIKRHSLFKSAPIHNTKWRRSTAPITALCIRNPSRTVTRRRHFVLASLPSPFPLSLSIHGRKNSTKPRNAVHEDGLLFFLLRPPPYYLADHYTFPSFRFFDDSSLAKFLRRKYRRGKYRGGERGSYVLSSASVDRDLSREGRTTSLAVNIPGKSVLCRI